MFIKQERNGDGQSWTLRRPQKAKEPPQRMKLRSKSPLLLQLFLLPGLGSALLAESWEKELLRSLPTKGRDWGRWGWGSIRRRKMGETKRSGPQPPPHLRLPDGPGGAAGQACGAGWGGVGCAGEGLSGLAAPSSQSMTFQRPAPRLPQASSQPTRRQPVAAGLLGSPPHT